MMEEIMTGSRRVDNFDGDVNVQHSLNVGARAKINGSAGIKGNLHVGGMLMSELVSSKCMGIFETEAELKATHPNPQKGMYAGVGFDFDKADKMPKLYVCKNDGEWYATGKTFTNEATAAFEEAMQSVFEAHEEARQAESNTNEQTRQANENQRIANENARQAAEAARQKAIEELEDGVDGLEIKLNTVDYRLKVAEKVAKGTVNYLKLDTLNNINTLGVYTISMIGASGSFGTLIVSAFSSRLVQFYIGNADPSNQWTSERTYHRIYARHYSEGEWSEWSMIANETSMAQVEKIGDLTNLVTYNKESIVEAINEAYNHGGVSDDAIAKLTTRMSALERANKSLNLTVLTLSAKLNVLERAAIEHGWTISQDNPDLNGGGGTDAGDIGGPV